MRVVAAPDKFRGTVSAAGAAAAVAAAVGAAGGTCTEVPMADGGEGFLDALGGANRTMVATGPLGDPVDVGWRLRGDVAVVEMAGASGLHLLASDELSGAEANDPVSASTHGTGEVIAAAVDAGAQRIMVGVGGSATTDGGFGALRALYPLQRLRGIAIEVACDVRTRFVDAAPVFAPQKGATPAQVELLRRRLERLAEVYLAEYGVDVTGVDGGGAGGGIAGGLAAVGARLVPGFEVVADEVDLFEHLETADLVVTGEGFVDRESFDGKVVGGVLAYAAELGIPALVVAGQVFDDDEVARALASGGDGPSGSGGATVTVVSLAERFGMDRATTDTEACIIEVVAAHLAAMPTA